MGLRIALYLHLLCLFSEAAPKKGKNDRNYWTTALLTLRPLNSTENKLFRKVYRVLRFCGVYPENYVYKVDNSKVNDSVHYSEIQM